MRVGLKNLASIPKASGKGFKALYFKYIVLRVADIAAERDFYTSLLGMKVVSNKKDDVSLQFGQKTLVLRSSDGAKPSCNEFGIVVANYNEAKVKAEAGRRGPQHESQIRSVGCSSTVEWSRDRHRRASLTRNQWLCATSISLEDRSGRRRSALLPINAEPAQRGQRGQGAGGQGGQVPLDLLTPLRAPKFTYAQAGHRRAFPLASAGIPGAD